MQSILKALNLRNADHNEVEILFTSYFNRWRINGTRTIYEREPDNPALMVSYTKNGSIKDIVLGPAAQAQDFSKLTELIDSELFGEQVYRVGQRFLFCDTLVTGYFRTAEFQILPAPPEAPKQTDPYRGKHPFLLEFRFLASRDSSLNMVRRTSAEQRWAALLNGLSVIPISRPSILSQSVWVRGSPSGEAPSRLAQTGYHFEGQSRERSEFSSITSIPEIPQLDPQEYYATRGGRGFNLSSDLETSLDTYRSLSQDNRRRFERACYWFQHAQQVYYISNSATLVSLVTAIEALRPLTRKRDRCGSCGQITGATKEFHQLVETLAPGASVIKDGLYAARSNAVHGLIVQDGDFGSHPGIGRFFQNSEELSRLFTLVKIILHNWLGHVKRSPEEALD